VGGARFSRAGRAERRVDGRAAVTSCRPRDFGAVGGGSAAPSVVAAAAVSHVAALCAAAAFAASARGARLVGRTSPVRGRGRRRGSQRRGGRQGQHSRVVKRDGPLDDVEGAATCTDGRHFVVGRAPSARRGGRGAARIRPQLVVDAGQAGTSVACGVGDGDTPATRHREQRCTQRHGGRVATHAVARRRPRNRFLCRERADRQDGIEWCGVAAALVPWRGGGRAARGRRGGVASGARCCRRCRGGRWSWREAASRGDRQAPLPVHARLWQHVCASVRYVCGLCWEGCVCRWGRGCDRVGKNSVRAGGSLWVVVVVPLHKGAFGASQGCGANAGRGTLLEGGGRGRGHPTWGLGGGQAGSRHSLPPLGSPILTRGDTCWCCPLMPPCLCARQLDCSSALPAAAHHTSFSHPLRRADCKYVAPLRYADGDR